MPITITGSKEVQAALAKLSPQYAGALAQALYAEGFALQAVAQKKAPVEFGVLRNSAYTAPPAGEEIMVEVGFGTKYARAQHERTELRHPRGGESKYLEKAFNERSSGLASRIAARVQAMVEAGKGLSPISPLGPTKPVVTGERRAKSASMRRKRRRK